MQRIPSLDGMRAVSVAAVIAGHLALSFTDGAIAHIGFIGVKVFFVISGFLITSILIDEGEVSLKQFYIRRALRILPLAYAFVLIVAIAWKVGLLESSHRDLAIASTYLMSYFHPHFEVAHLWSLSVEEQFYLLWPVVFVLAAKRASSVALAVVIAGPFIRAAWWFAFPAHREMVETAFPNVADTIAIGCWAAFHPIECKRFGAGLPAPLVALLPILAWLVWQSPPFLPAGVLRMAFVPCVDSVVNALLLLFVIGAVHATGWLGGFLNSRPLVFIGVISYSLYIWQQLFVRQANPSVIGTLGRIVIIFSVATATHYTIERPFVRLKDRFTLKEQRLQAAAP